MAETQKPAAEPTEASAAPVPVEGAETQAKTDVSPPKVEEPAEAGAAAKMEDLTLQEKTTSAAEPAKTGSETAATETAQKETPAAAAVGTTTTTAATEQEQPKANTPIQELYAAFRTQTHPEIWGVSLQDPEHHVPSQIVFQKYLNANDGDLAKAKDQLLKTLEWRLKIDPLEASIATWSKDKFDRLGYVTSYGDSSQGAEGKEVFTWNVYGHVKDMDHTFSDQNEFLNWRVGLMELALKELNISAATQPITATWDPYKIYQVHDYKSVSFFRQNPKVKSAVKETVQVFGQNYPELLKQKFFVNVPVIMGWVYAVVKLFVADRTASKFHPMGNGANMSAEFADSKVPALGEKLPKDYGGQGEGLEVQGTQTLLD